MSDYKWLVAAFLLIGLIAVILMLVSCDKRPPQMVRDCLKTETTTVLVPKAMDPLNPVPTGVKGLRWKQVTNCVEYSPWRENPEYKAWLERHSHE